MNSERSRIVSLSPLVKQRTSFLLGVLATAPFLPALVEFWRRGIPDRLFAGDAAALELGTWHAARGHQLLGPYSRFGWNHPGPAFFYLSVPVYELFSERGPALSLFALGAELASALAIVFTAHRLSGRLFAVIVAALLAVFELIALPFLLANEWNPVFPILPFVLVCFLAARVAAGAGSLLPALVFVGSVIVQTHVAFAPEVIALSVYAVVRRPPSGQAAPLGRWIVPLTLGIFAVCWALPTIEAFTTHPGDLQQILSFFSPMRTDFPQHTWREAFETVARQMSAVPWALFQTISQSRSTGPGILLAVFLATAELVCLRAAVRHTDPGERGGVRRLAEIVLLTTVIAVLSVRAIRGEILVYLVSWYSVTGLLATAVIITGAAGRLRRSIGADRTFTIVVTCACLVLGLAMTAPVRRPSVIHGSTAEVDHIAPIVNDFLRRRGDEAPTVFIPSKEVWPTAVGVVLYLRKHDMPVTVEQAWLNVGGRPLRESPGQHPGLFFTDDVAAQRLRAEGGFVEIASALGTHVLFRPRSK
jgi:hypothetical protein